MKHTQMWTAGQPFLGMASYPEMDSRTAISGYDFLSRNGQSVCPLSRNGPCTESGHTNETAKNFKWLTKFQVPVQVLI